MSLKGSDVFSLLAAPVREALAGLGFREPTEPQRRAIPPILEGRNVLLLAPNGSGKTEAVLLPIFSKFLLRTEREGISILYITPLRSLNRDMVRRLNYWAESLGFTVDVRHGDTSVGVRRKQALRPPNMLVTTPETLQAILPGRLMRRHLGNVRFVIIDEVHEMAESKRGVQLTVALERLFEITGKEFQRVGLSATVGKPGEVANLIAGGRQIELIEVPTPKGYRYHVEYPVPSDIDYDLAHDLKTAPEAAARIRRILDLVNTHTSTLIFVNSRPNAEMLGYRLGLLESSIAVHHGSLSREERSSIEDGFKAGRLRAIVCTSTLELGIDIGHVDLVIQYLSPRQVGSLIQRVGRSGHRLDLTSKGIIITASTDDLLEAAAATQLAYRNVLEPVSIHREALDVLAHQIAGLLMDIGEVTFEKALRIIRRAHPYKDLPKDRFLGVIDYMGALRLLSVDGGLLRRNRKTRGYYYENLSMIPDERRYPIINIISDRRIGTLGDEFMALRARIGLNFICKGRVWRIVEIEEDTGIVYVIPSEDPMAAIPGWDGEMLPVSKTLAQETGRLRQVIVEELRGGKRLEEIEEDLAESFSVEKGAIRGVVEEVAEHLKTGVQVPTHNIILVEAFDKFLIIHSCFGEIVNKTLGCIFDSILSEHEMVTGWWNDGYRILIETPRRVEKHDLVRVRSLLFNLSDDDVDGAFNVYLEAKFPFSYKMKFIAERFGVLPRGRRMGPKALAELPAAFKGTPIFDETMREVMIEKVDLASVKEMMTSIRRGLIRIETTLRFERPTPMARRILSAHSEILELMAPQRILLTNIERMKRTLRSRVIKLLCLSCGDWKTKMRLRETPERPTCDLCGSGLLTVLKDGDDPEVLRELLKRRLRGLKLDDDDVKRLAYARRVADLILSYGRQAALALQVKGVGPETASRILGKMYTDEDEFYIDLLKAKIRFLRTRQYWDENRRRFW